MAADALTLGYHAISERWAAPLSVTPDQFQRQLDILVRRGYTAVTFSDAVAGRPGGKVVAITFDDAFKSVLLAAPMLASAGMVATVFVPTGFPGGTGPLRWPGIDQWLGGPYESELEPLSWDELGELADAGWEIGAHTRTHPHLTTLDDRELDEELRGSRADCAEALGRPCDSLAYPYGDYDERVAAAAGRAGYAAAATMLAQPPEAGALSWPRIGVYNVDSVRRFRFKIATGPLGLRAIRKRRPVARGS
jgi:peptidoglycan/xylan/chitin deacetylase (PgdA/CDA1 family)